MTADIARGIVAWLGTYALHSTLLVGAVWVLLRWRQVPDHLLRETLWKTALVGALLTTTLQGALGGPLWAPSLTLSGPVVADGRAEGPAEVAAADTDSAAADAAADWEASEPALDLAMNLTVALETGERAGLPAAASPGEPRLSSSVVHPVAVPPAVVEGEGAARRLARTGPAERTAESPVDAASGEGLWLALAAVWMLGAGWGLLRLVGARLRLTAALGPRRPVTDGRALDTLEALCARAGVSVPRLTCAAGLNVPVALGWTRRRREICVPGKALTALPPAEQECMLAHELAHLVRRDPLWVLVSRAVEAVFFFQPLNRVARRELMESAEFLCDAWAVRQTGAPLSLARCLAQVADWIAGPTHGAPVAAMAQSRSTLLRRVGRLVEAGPSGERRRWWRRPLALAALVLVAGVTPAVTSAQDADEAARWRERAQVEAEQAAREAAAVQAELAAQREALEELRRSQAEVLEALRRQRSAEAQARSSDPFGLAETEYEQARGQYEQQLARAERQQLEAQLAELRERMHVGRSELTSAQEQLGLLEERRALARAEERADAVQNELEIRAVDLETLLVQRQHELMALEQRMQDVRSRLADVRVDAEQRAAAWHEHEAQREARREARREVEWEAERQARAEAEWQADRAEWNRQGDAADVEWEPRSRADAHAEAGQRLRADSQDRGSGRRGLASRRDRPPETARRSSSSDLVRALGEFESWQQDLVAGRLREHFAALANLDEDQARQWDGHAQEVAALLLATLEGSTQLDRAADGTVDVRWEYGPAAGTPDEERLFQLASELGVRDELRREALVEASFRVARELQGGLGGEFRSAPPARRSGLR